MFINGSSTNTSTVLHHAKSAARTTEPSGCLLGGGTVNPFPLLEVIDAVWNQNGQLKVENAVGAGTPGSYAALGVSFRRNMSAAQVVSTRGVAGILGRGMTWNQNGTFSMSYSDGYAQGPTQDLSCVVRS